MYTSNRYQADQFVVVAKRNIAVCNTLKEVFNFLQFIQGQGITSANIIGTDLSVRLTENGFWVWVK